MKKIFIFLLLIVSVTNLFAQKESREITIADLWENYTFWAASVEGLNSMNDGEHYSVISDKMVIEKYNYKTGQKVADILDLKPLKVGRVDEYEFSADESKILFYTDAEKIYRWSFTANYFVYDLKNSKLIMVSENGKQQLATFSPDGLKVAFVRSNNLFVKDLLTGNETQLTSDGKYNEIINGAPDWVYEEEFGFSKAFDWSPDSKNLAYMRFDESKVKMFNMTLFAGLKPKKAENVLYPENSTFKYPKAGEDNSIVSVHLYNLDNNKTIKVDVGQETDQYIPRLKFTNDAGILSVLRLNRLQNKIEILFVNTADGSGKTIYTEENKWYIEEDNFDNLTYLPGNKNFIITSERDGYRHLYLYDITGNLIKQLTTGNWEVTDFLGYDEKNKVFYYTSTEESPLRRTTYAISADGKTKKKISTDLGTNSTQFSKGFKYYINTFSNIRTPKTITLYDIKGNKIRVLEDNATLKQKADEYGGINREFFTFKTSENVELYGIMIVPPYFDKTKKYPVLITQYNGPNSQQVKDAWEFGWEEMMAQKGIIVVSVDTRGTGFRGEEFKKQTYLNLGKYETLDMIETAKYLGSLSYIDANRIGIWGWSYGGFMVASCLTKGADYFKMGVAVAPVTNWRYYDNIYTERFMRKPQENANGYDDNSPINHVEKLKGKLLIVHGSADDNVHVQNTMEFAEALVQAGKQFDMMIYNNRNHSIYGGKTRSHLYNMMTDYILKNL